MSYSIYDSFLTIADCKYYCKQVASRLNLNVYDYFYDNRNKIKFPGDSNIRNFEDFKSYEDWRVRFNLACPKTIKKIGLDEYVTRKHELKFNLTIKGYSFLYICRFSDPNYNENIINAVVEPNNNIAYIEEDDHQLSFIL